MDNNILNLLKDNNILEKLEDCVDEEEAIAFLKKNALWNKAVDHSNLEALKMAYQTQSESHENNLNFQQLDNVVGGMKRKQIHQQNHNFPDKYIEKSEKHEPEDADDLAYTDGVCSHNGSESDTDTDYSYSANYNPKNQEMIELASNLSKDLKSLFPDSSEKIDAIEEACNLLCTKWKNGHLTVAIISERAKNSLEKKDYSELEKLHKDILPTVTSNGVTISDALYSEMMQTYAQ